MIIPAVIPKSISDLKEKLELTSFSRAIQVDLVDGKFVPDISWPYKDGGEVNEAQELIKDRELELDLMVENPIIVARDWLAIGAKRIVFHLESLNEMDDAIVLRKEFDFELGLSLSNSTPLEKLYPHIENLDFIQLMGIREIGSQGQPFDSTVIDRIITMRQLYPNILITVDGGVTEETIVSLKNAGANRFVVGSNILKAENPKAQYEKLLKIISS